MKSRAAFLVITFLFILACNFSGWKKLDLGTFEISVPENWRLKPLKSIDSFAGEFLGRKVELIFDYSKQGYAANLIPTEQEYLNALWIKMWISPEDAEQPFDYRQAEDMWRLACRDRKYILMRDHSADAEKKRKNLAITFTRSPGNDAPKLKPADYIALIKGTRRSDTIPVFIPRQIKQQNFAIDTNGKFVTKLTWPKVPGKGLTGIFIYRIDSDFTFNLHGEDLSAQNQQIALQVFKTIKFK